MRGKLRDKRIELKRDSFKRESMERRRVNKRVNRSMALLILQQDQEEDYPLDENEEILAEETTK